MSELRATTISNLAGTGPVTLTGQSAAKAWNNTNGAGTVINDSFNISSLTDVDVGRQEHNVISAFANSNHVPNYSLDNNINQLWTASLSSSKWRTNSYTGSIYQDNGVRTVSHGDLA